jgi:hypothetical protein
LAGGEAHTVVLKSDGTVWTFGKNSSGQRILGGRRRSHEPCRSRQHQRVAPPALTRMEGLKLLMASRAALQIERARRSSPLAAVRRSITNHGSSSTNEERPRTPQFGYASTRGRASLDANQMVG